MPDTPQPHVEEAPKVIVRLGGTLEIDLSGISPVTPATD